MLSRLHTSILISLSLTSFATAASAQTPPTPEQAARALDTPPVDDVTVPTTGIDVLALMTGTEGGMTAERVAERAVETAPSVERAEAALAQARAGAARATIAFFPQASVSFGYTRLSEVNQGSLFASLTPEQQMLTQNTINAVQDPAARGLFQANFDGTMAQSNFRFPQVLDNFTLQANVSYPLTDILLRVIPQNDAQQALTNASELQAEAQREQVAQSAREAFYNYLRARGSLLIAQQTLAQTEARMHDVEAFVAAGTVARVELLRLQAAVATTRVVLVRAEGGEAIAAAAVRTLLHAPDDTQITLGEDLTGELPQPTGSMESLIQYASDHRVEARALHRVLEARSGLVRIQEAGRLPRIDLSGNFTLANPNQRVFPSTAEFRESWSLSAVASWSLTGFFDAEQAANQSRADYASTEADIGALEDGIRLEVTQAYEGLRAARGSLEAARLGIEASEESYRVRVERLRAGAATSTEVLDAETELANARLQLLNAAVDQRIAASRVRRALGDDPF